MSMVPGNRSRDDETAGGIPCRCEGPIGCWDGGTWLWQLGSKCSVFHTQSQVNLQIILNHGIMSWLSDINSYFISMGFYGFARPSTAPQIHPNSTDSSETFHGLRRNSMIIFPCTLVPPMCINMSSFTYIYIYMYIHIYIYVYTYIYIYIHREAP